MNLTEEGASRLTEIESLCTGCGAVLQTDRPNEPGYVPKTALTRALPVCKRCFRIRNYGEFSRIEVPSEVYEEQVSQILHKPGLVLYVLDVFDLAGSFVKSLSKYVGNSKVVVVVNKVDLLPREVEVEALREWVSQEVEKTGVRAHHVLFVSAQSQSGIDDVTQTLSDEMISPVYVVGMANVGKSTLLNGILSQLGAEQRFTASRVPGTTIGLVAAKVRVEGGEELSVVDTPGLIHGTRVTDRLCPHCLKVAVPSHRLRPRVFQLNCEQSLWLGGFVRFDFAQGPRQSVVCYVSNDLVVHRTKLERAEYIRDAHADDILQVPCSECRSQFEDYQMFSVVSKRFEREASKSTKILSVPRAGCDVVLPGLGWISLFGSDFSGQISVPKGITPSIRRRLIGDVSRSTDSGRDSFKWS